MTSPTDETRAVRPNRIRTARKSFGHVFYENPSPCVPGYCCCMCGFFTEKLDARAKKLVCGHVTYPVLT